MARTYRGARRAEWRRDRSRNRDLADLRLSRIEPVPLCRVRPGTIVLADVPFQGSDGSRPDERKLRPALVAQRSGRQVTVLPISTKRGRLRSLRLPDGILTRRSFVQGRLVELDRVAITRVITDVDITEHPDLEAHLRRAIADGDAFERAGGRAAA